MDPRVPHQDGLGLANRHITALSSHCIGRQGGRRIHMPLILSPRGMPIPVTCPHRSWYPERDSNPHCSVPKTDASCQLGYPGKPGAGGRTRTFDVFRMGLSGYSRLPPPLGHACMMVRRMRIQNPHTTGSRPTSYAVVPAIDARFKLSKIWRSRWESNPLKRCCRPPPNRSDSGPLVREVGFEPTRGSF